MHRFSRPASVIVCFSLFAFCAAHTPAARGASQNAALFAPLRVLAGYLGLSAPVSPQKPQTKSVAKPQTRPIRLAGASASGISSNAFTFTVDNIGNGGDSSLDGICSTNGTSFGSCTLRAAIQEANANSGSDIINFNISGATTPVIQPSAALPAILETVIIDGTTQNGPSDTADVTIDGTNAGNAGGLTVAAPSCQIKGLCIVNFTGIAIAVSNSSNSTTIKSCHIGVEADGITDAGNGSGILLGSTNNLIGGLTTTPGKFGGNVISGNSGNGISDVGDGSANTVGNTIQGNVIGLSADQSTKVPNNRGISISSRNNSIVGALAAGRNVISGNTDVGIELQMNPAAGADGIIVQGNRIGTNDSSAAGLGNGSDGIFIGGAGDSILSNTIIGNGGNGIQLFNATDTIIQQNNIGFAGNGNTGSGIFLSNGAKNNVIGATFNDSTPGPEGNLIAGNRTGVSVFSGANDATGNTIRGNTIRQNTALGINLNGDGNTGDGATANDDDLSGATDDVDAGNNNLQNFPNITSLAGNNIIGNFHSTPGKSFVLDFYRNVTPDSSGFGEGETLITSQPVTTLPNGDVNFSFSAGSAIGSDTITATATRTSATDATGTRGDTSEFSLGFGGSALPTLSITDVTVPEGNTGTANATFTVALSAASTQTITVDFATANNVATQPADYTQQNGTLTFAPGQSAKTITVLVKGDVLDEDLETYFVNLTNPSNATIADAQGLGFITDNDAEPSLTINNVSVTEDDINLVGATFTITLSGVSGRDVEVDVASANGTATAGTDYNAISGTLTIPAGNLTGISTVPVRPDTLFEPDENFFLNLSSALNATIADNQGIGTIRNNDVSLVVTTAADTTNSGDGLTSLREAINAANATAGAQTITFSIGTGVQTITPTTPLPVISDTVTIDGSTQGVSGTPLIVLSGQNSGVRPPTSFAAALQITADNCVVRSLCFNNGFPGGIAIFGEAGNTLASGNKIERCFFGTNAAGTAASALSGPGIYLSGGGIAGNGATNNIIGGTSATQRNVINSNKPSSGYGVLMEGAATTGNRIIGNYIGTNAAGTGAIGNAYGVGIASDAHDNFVGGTTPAERNVISGNDTGILIYSNANTVQGNFIGTNFTGNVALANDTAGVSMDAGASGNLIGGVATTPGAGRGNVISGNGDGVEIIGRSFGTGAFSRNNRVQGNLIGVKANRSGALANGVGVVIQQGAQTNTIGGTTAGQGNVISGNSNGGILVSNFGGPAAPDNTANNTIAGNLIGLTTDGLSGLPNGGAGVSLDFQTSGNKIGLAGATGGNVISGNNIVPASGLSIGQGCFDNVVVNNLIGTNKNGTAAVANQVGISIAFNAHDNTIGGVTPAERNVISGNAQAGIAFGDGANNNDVLGNLIGTQIDGTSALANGAGITIGAGGPGLAGAVNNTIGGTAVGQSNTIAFNGSDGVTIVNDGTTAPTGNNILGNAIRSNTGHGVSTAASNTAIRQNTIELNTGTGVRVNSGVASSISRNLIRNNGGLGINLVGGTEQASGVTNNDETTTPFDGDSGPNGLQNYPTLTSATLEPAGGVRVQGTLRSTPGTTFNIEYYESLTADPSGFGEGATFMAARSVTTTPGGVATINEVLAGGTVGRRITAIAVKSTGDTSEFSQAVTIAGATSTLSINDVTVTEGNSGTTNAVFTVTRAGSTSGAVSVNFATANGTAVAPGDYTARSGTLTLAAGQTTGQIIVTVNGGTVDEANETFNVVLSAPSGATIADGTGLGTITNDDVPPRFVVDTTSDANLTACTAAAGDCSLRGAINRATADATPQTIAFAIPGSGVPTITLSSPLPPITQPLTIDGFSQNPATGRPQVEINGNGRNFGVTLQGANSTVKGLIINLCNIAGVRITGAAAQNNRVQGCYIGTNSGGTSLLPNQDGVEISGGAKNNILGGTGTARNLISGNFGRGVFITGAGTTGNQLTGNFIGTKRDGLSALSNGAGVEIVAGAGSNTIGGTGARNFISGNDRGGVFINGANDNKVQGNYIGVNVNGSAALPNGGSGVEISGAAKNNLVGGATSSLRNIIAGNTGRGVLISGLGSDGNRVQGNYIGTNATGAAAIANASDGVAVSSGAKNNVIGGATSGSGNLISGNRLSGVSIEGDTTASNTVIGNRIGVAANSTTSLPNNGRGVSIVAADNNVIGGTSGNSNLIANNKSDGVAVTNVGGPATGNRIRGNRIFNNTGLGIDLADNGVTLNDAGDADNGPNRLQNFADITDAGQLGAGQPLQLSGSFAGAPSRDFIIDVYASAAQDPLLFGEGEKYLGSFNITTDAGGAANFARSIGGATLPDLSNQFITLTATDSLFGDTSEFSKAFKVPATSGLVVTPPGVTPPTPLTLLPCEQQQFTASVAGVPVAVKWTATGGTITPSNAGTVPVASINYKPGNSGSFTLTATPPSGAPVSVTINVTASPDNLFGWGFNTYGSVGDGTTSHQNAPVDVNLPAPPTIIAAGGSHSLAVSDGKLFAWGLNQDFQLGLGDQSNRATPTQVLGIDGTKVTALAGGWYHSLAVVGGQVFAWGYNRYGQCGQPPGTGDPHVLVPTRVPNLSNVVEVSAGIYFSLARTSNGEVYAWGNNLYGQCGPAASGTVQVTPVKVTQLGSASRISAGAAHSTALVGGQVFGWGLNETGQLGNGINGTGQQSANPVRAGTLSGMTLLAAGYAHTLAGNATTVFSWGNNSKNELGRNGTTNAATPGAIAGLSGVTKLAAGSAHNLAVKSDGSLWSWGFNNYGSSGLGDTANRATPQQVTRLRGVSNVAAGYAHSLAVAKEDLCALPAAALKASAQQKSEVASAVLDSGTAFSSSDSIVLTLSSSDKAPTFFRVAVNGRDVEVQGVQKSQDSTTLLLPSGTLKPGDEVLVTWNNLDGAQSLTLKAE